jgi:hypothetical protein
MRNSCLRGHPFPFRMLVPQTPQQRQRIGTTCASFSRGVWPRSTSPRSVGGGRSWLLLRTGLRGVSCFRLADIEADLRLGGFGKRQEQRTDLLIEVSQGGIVRQQQLFDFGKQLSRLPRALAPLIRHAEECYRAPSTCDIIVNMSALSSLKLDKTALTVAALFAQSDDAAYWHAQSPYVRLQAVDTLRQLNYGHRQSTARLQKVLEAAQQASR